MNNLITDKDYQLLSEKLSLDINKLKSLCEENEDFYNLIHNIIDKFTIKEILRFSNELYPILLIIKNVKNTDISLKEKLYISTSISDLLNKIPTLKNGELITNYAFNEKAAKFNLVLCGFFNKEYTTQHLVTIQNGLKKAGFSREKAIFWIEELRKIRKEIFLAQKI